MTRPGKKLDERGTLDRVLGALGLRPDEPAQEGEAPDFMVRLSGRNVGVEITTYQSGATVEDGSGRREAEGELDRLTPAASARPGT